MTIRALLVEDNPGDARLIREMLRSSEVELVHADRLASGLQVLKQEGLDVVLLDLSLPDSQGFETLQAAHAAAPTMPVVVLSGLDDQALALHALRDGAQDYLVKGQVDGGTIIRAMRYAIERQRLEAVRQDLERQRDEFFSSVSHDLRTPVAAIKAAIGVVLANEPSDLAPALHRLLVNIDLAADELTRMIQDLLEIARLQAGRVELYPTEVDLRDVITRAARPLEPLVVARRQTLDLLLPDEPGVLEVDGLRFSRVVRNLVGNAQKYGREGSRIRVALERGEREVCVSVNDD